MTNDGIHYTETERAIDRFNQQSRARHLLMVIEVRKVATAIRKLAKVIQSRK